MKKQKQNKLSNLKVDNRDAVDWIVRLMFAWEFSGQVVTGRKGKEN